MLQPVPLHMKLHCTGMEIPIFSNLYPNIVKGNLQQTV